MSESPFFSPYKQSDIPIRQYRGKSPMFYRDAAFMGAVFTAELGALRELLKDSGLSPVEVWPGRGLAAIFCLQYRDSDIGPYNEVSLSLPVRRRGFGPLEALRALQSGSFHAWVAELPVTTEAALYGGVDYFNYPKYLAEISFREEGGRRSCALRDKATGELILEFSGEKIGTKASPGPAGSLLEFNTYPRKDGRSLRARMLVNELDGGASYLRERARLSLGGHPRAEPFRRLKLGRQLYHLSVPRCEAILFMPEILPPE